jgi:hypothetical protein
MDKVEDVERLSSWLKAPMVHYREFAPQREVAEAVATWPIVHRAAVQTGMAAEDEPAPQGSTAARERIARDSRSLPTAVQAIQQNPPPGAQAAAPGETSPAALSDDRLGATLGERVQAARVEPAAITPEPEPYAAAQPVPDAAEPIMAGFEEPPAAWTEPHDGEHPEPARHYPARDRGALFAGEYRGREREARPESRVADRQDRSLDAVFSRLSGPRDRLPDPRARARTSPGLGPVFGRLR